MSLPTVGVALLLLLVTIAVHTNEIEHNSDSGLHGDVRSVRVISTQYSWVDGEWLASPAFQQKQEYFDRHGRLVSRTTYRQNGIKDQHLEFNYHDTRTIRSLLIQRYNYNGELINWRLKEYRSDGVLISDITKNSRGTVTSRRTRIDLDDGYRIEFRNINSSGRISYREDALFDGHSRIIQELQQPGDYSSRSIRNYEYDDEGRLQTVTHRLGGQDQGFWNYSYGDDGNLLEINHFGPAGVLRSTRSYLYNRFGNVREERAEHVDLGGLEHFWSYSFDLQGNLLRQSYLQTFTDFVLETTNEYDDENHVVWTRVSDTIGEPYVVTEHLYDEAGGQIRMQRVEKGLTTGFSEDFTYDSHGRMILRNRYSHDGVWQSGNRHVYDTHGNRIEESSLNADGSYQSKTTYDYEYDNYGNWIRFTRLVSNNISEDYGRIHQINSRQISYYD